MTSGHQIYRAALAMLPELYVAASPAEFPKHLVALARRLIPCDTAAFNLVNVARKRACVYMDPSPREFGVDAFETLAQATIDEHPLIRYYETGGSAPALRLSDFVTRRKLRRMRLYHEAFRPVRIEFLIVAAERDPLTGDHLALSLGRAAHDFDDGELGLLSVLQPHLIQAHRNTRRFRCPVMVASGVQTSIETSQLSVREQAVLHWIAQGKTSAETGAILAISRRTVDKHLERIYQKLGAENRITAAAMYWDSAQIDAAPQAAPPRR